MLLLESQRRWRKTYKTKLFATPSREKEKGEKKREARGQEKVPPFLHCLLGALKTGRK